MPELAMNGGTPVRATSYPSWPVCDERDVEAVTTVVKSGYWGGFPEPGPNAERFEEAFAAYQGAEHGVLMANGTVTMEVALKALGIGWGDEVIVPALTFAATAYAPMASGAVPVLVDVEPRTWTIDPERVEAGKELERLLADVPGVRVMPADERITRWSFYNYIFAIDPDSFGGRTNEVVCAALEAEGIPAEVQYPPMSRYELFQTSLSRLPVAVEHADRLDPQRMSFPVAEAAGLRESVYLMENVFRDGSRGVQDVVEALTKVQRNADELPA